MSSRRFLAVELRSITSDNVIFLKEMCHMAVYQTIGDATPRDEIPSIEQAMTKPWFSRYIEDWGREEDYGVIATANGAEAGAAWYRKFQDEDSPPYELSLAVHASYRRKRIGHTLLSNILEHAKSVGVPEMSLYVREDNSAARNLYEKLGFRPVGQQSVFMLMATSLH